jgi:hydroxymethylbilane synthase
MTKSSLRIATRQSPLALWQAEYIKATLEKHHPDTAIELKKFKTQGDKILDQSLSKIGGKGLFIKELEHALLNDEADLAVHCLKDMPYHMPDGLILGAIDEGASPFDALVSPKYDSFEALPAGAVVGTSSLRRQAQLLAWRNDITIKPLRGNLQTRMSKLDSGEFDAIILAVAGLERLGLGDKVRQILPAQHLIPAVGQGVLAIQIRANDEAVAKAIAPLHHTPTALRIAAERAMNLALEGSCQVPIAGYCILEGGASAPTALSLTGMVGQPDGQRLLIETQQTETVTLESASDLGSQVAAALRAQGADEILAALSTQSGTQAPQAGQ